MNQCKEIPEVSTSPAAEGKLPVMDFISKGRVKGLDVFFAFNFALFLLMCVFTYYARWTQYAGQGRIAVAEFFFYAMVMIATISAAWVWLRRYVFPTWLLALVEVGILAQFAGGLIHFGGTRLYDHVFFHIRYDKYVHCGGAFIVAMVVQEIFRIKKVPLNGFSRFLVFLAMLGLGVAQELVEYVVVLTVPQNGVGDLNDTFWDLIADACGGVVYLVIMGKMTFSRRKLGSYHCDRPMETTDKNRRPFKLLPESLWGRGLFGLGTGLGLLVLAAAVTVLSVWVEDRFPSGDEKRALAPGVQRVLTKPVVNALNSQIDRYVRSRAEALYMHTGLTLDETITRFLDERVDLSQRRIYAYRLARVGSPEAITALLRIFQNAPPEHKAFMAQLIGSTGNPAAKQWLSPLLDAADERVAIAAIRGLCAIGGDEVSARIAEILFDEQRSDRVRVEAAQGLGVIGTPAALEALAAAFGQVSQEEVAAQILKSLGQFSFPTVADAFAQFLAAPDTPEEMRVVAVEALAFSTQEAVPFLLELAGNDASADVRASAAWAISAHYDDPSLGATLAGLAEQEADVDVRRRLYEAMLEQANIPAERLLPVVQAEDDIAARVAGFNAIGRAAGLEPSSTLGAVFDQQIVPELLRIATSENSLNIQMRAVFALRRAETTAAQDALAAIAKTARNQVAMAAHNGLRARNR